MGSKTKGNGMPLIQVRERFGADLYRLSIAMGTSFDQEFDFRERDIPQLRAKFETWKKLMSGAKAAAPKAEDEMADIDRWLRSRFYSRVEEYWPAMNSVRFRDAFVSIFYEFMKNVSYHTRRTSAANTAAVVRTFFVDYLLLMAPVVPHVCEELYTGEGPEGTFMSLLAFDRTRPLEQYIDKRVEIFEAMPLDLVGMVGEEMAKRQKENKKTIVKSIKKVDGNTPENATVTQAAPLQISIVQARQEMFCFFDVLGDTLKSTRNAKEIKEAMRTAFSDQDWKNFIEYFVPRTLGSSGLHPYLAHGLERTFLKEHAIPFIKSEFPDAEVSITDADVVVSKRHLALPGKPVIVIL